MRARPKYVTVQHVAQQFAVSPKTVYRWIERGFLPAEKVGTPRPGVRHDGRPVRIAAEAVDGLLCRKGVKHG